MQYEEDEKLTKLRCRITIQIQSKFIVVAKSILVKMSALNICRFGPNNFIDAIRLI